MKLDEKQIHDFAITVVNSTPVEGDSPESIVQKKLELYVEAIRQATTLTVKVDKAENKKYEQYYESGKFRI